MERGNRSYENMKMRLDTGKPLNLNDQINHRGPNSSQQGLAGVVRYPTITVNDAKNSLSASQRGRGTLTARIVETKGEGERQLNPDWVETLMGYPQGWTDIEKAEIKEGSDYPQAWLNGTWEDGILRIATGIKNRVKRLKCLGNAIVPQIAALLWMVITGKKGGIE
jgi:hypothetical protein